VSALVASVEMGTNSVGPFQFSPL